MRAALLEAARVQWQDRQQPRRTVRQLTREPWQGPGLPAGAAIAPQRLSRRRLRPGAPCGQLLCWVLSQQDPLQRPMRGLPQARSWLRWLPRCALLSLAMKRYALRLW